jgi:hypothetical protein
MGPYVVDKEKMAMLLLGMAESAGVVESGSSCKSTFYVDDYSNDVFGDSYLFSTKEFRLDSVFF